MRGTEAKCHFVSRLRAAQATMEQEPSSGSGSGSTTFGDLPDDVLSSVYRFLPLSDIGRGMRLAKRFHTGLMDSGIWNARVEALGLPVMDASPYHTLQSVYSQV